MDKRKRGHQRLKREGQTTQWTKERGVIKGHKEKDRQPKWTKEKGVIRGHEEK